jgi:hypothetical protein
MISSEETIGGRRRKKNPILSLRNRHSPMLQLQQVMSLVRYALLSRATHMIQQIVSLGCRQSQ